MSKKLWNDEKQIENLKQAQHSLRLQFRYEKKNNTINVIFFMRFASMQKKNFTKISSAHKGKSLNEIVAVSFWSDMLLRWFFPINLFSSFYAGFLFVLKAKKTKTTKNTIWRQRPDIKYKASIYIWYYIWRWNSSTVSLKEA